MSPARVWTVVAGVVLAIAAAVIAVRLHRDWRRATVKAEHLQAFCAWTAFAAEDSARVFDSNEDLLHVPTATRLATSHDMHWDAASQRLCTWAPLPPFPEPCRARRNWSCLARYEHEVYRALVEQPR